LSYAERLKSHFQPKHKPPSKTKFGFRGLAIMGYFLGLAVPCINKLKKRSIENYIDFIYKANSLIKDAEAAGTPVIRLRRSSGAALKANAR
jgi:hypothetical protein